MAIYSLYLLRKIFLIFRNSVFIKFINMCTPDKKRKLLMVLGSPCHRAGIAKFTFLKATLHSKRDHDSNKP